MVKAREWLLKWRHQITEITARGGGMLPGRGRVDALLAGLTGSAS